ncbi:hypothetical protein [Lysinibacillus sp. TE18511]
MKKLSALAMAAAIMGTGLMGTGSASAAEPVKPTASSPAIEQASGIEQLAYYAGDTNYQSLSWGFTNEGNVALGNTLSGSLKIVDAKTGLPVSGVGVRMQITDMNGAVVVHNSAPTMTSSSGWAYPSSGTSMLKAGGYYKVSIQVDDSSYAGQFANAYSPSGGFATQYVNIK